MKNTVNEGEKKKVLVSPADLPLSCPTPQMSLWNTHPKIYLPIEQSGEEICPYCGTCFILQTELGA